MTAGTRDAACRHAPPRCQQCSGVLSSAMVGRTSASASLICLYLRLPCLSCAVENICAGACPWAAQTHKRVISQAPSDVACRKRHAGVTRAYLTHTKAGARESTLKNKHSRLSAVISTSFSFRQCALLVVLTGCSKGSGPRWQAAGLSLGGAAWGRRGRRARTCLRPLLSPSSTPCCRARSGGCCARFSGSCPQCGWPQTAAVAATSLLCHWWKSSAGGCLLQGMSCCPGTAAGPRPAGQLPCLLLFWEGHQGAPAR